MKPTDKQEALHIFTINFLHGKYWHLGNEYIQSSESSGNFIRTFLVIKITPSITYNFKKKL